MERNEINDKIKCKSYITIFPECETVHLKKDVGMLPYSMGKYQGYEFKIVCYDHGDFCESDINKYHIECIEEKQGIIRDFSRYIVKNAKKIDVLNLYHITSTRNAYWILLYKICNPKGKVHVKLDADYRMIEVFDPYPKGLKSKLRVYILRKFVDIYTVETTELLEKLTSLWNIKIELLPNGVFIDEENSNREFLEPENVFLTVGRLGTEQKATEVLLDAFRIISDKTTWNLKLVGPMESEFEMYLEKYFKQYSMLRNRVEVYGNISDEKKLVEIYNKSKVFVLPSRWESFGLVLLEALERGNFLVVSNKIPSIKDISNGGSYCEIVEVDDAIALGNAMLEATKGKFDEDTRKEKSKWVVDNFSWKQLVKKLDVYIENS